MAVRLDDVQLAKSQKCYNVVLSGNKFLASLDSGLNAVSRGQWIEAEIQPAKDPKYPAWVGKWTHAAPPNAAPQVAVPTAPIPPSPAVAAPYQREPVHEPKYAEPAKPGTTAPYWLPMASNVVAHGIAAGIIKGPNDVRPWVRAVQMAAEQVTTNEENPPF